MVGGILSFGKFDDKNKYSMFILNNGEIRIYDSNKTPVKKYNMNSGMTSFRHSDIHKNVIYAG